MKSARGAESSRRNGMVSRGPKTTEGKRRSSLNATRHGILSESVAVPGLELEVEWQEHRWHLLRSLRPVGALEEALAERVAAVLWRLRRLALYERGVVENQQERGELERRAGLTSERNVEDLEDRVESLGRVYTLLEALQRGADCRAVTGEEAVAVLFEVTSDVDLDFWQVSYPGVPDDLTDQGLEEWDGWTSAVLRKCLAVIARLVLADPDALLASEAEKLRAQWFALSQELHRVSRKVVRLRRAGLIPTLPDLEKVTRYESHLERCLYKALNQLERLQDRRLGAAVPPPLVHEVTLTAG